MIRPGRPEDANAIAAIWNPLIRETTVTFTTQEKTAGDIADLLKRQPVFVAIPNDQIAGFATYGPFRPGPGYAHTAEHSIYLAAHARGNGLGRALMVRLETHARDQGLHVMVAGLSGDNKGAITFHTAMGYTEIGHLPRVGRKFDRWHDLVLMQKCL
ncbi:N-acetyltransferase family protein [Rhodophyticola sp. CCM32]|uniref:GNAT family N-acetyltransferase n=1 Tax=Rhodophyticola sp. CCM32 TaxID=2916397 RepID=UPI00107FA950|nr:GNAT family N-acetyltransferase [Rhodophyticola sp. CCM32]QBY01060.1 N-acetyltransferase family protein [Rhodophyticola sp. CCM32]